jgi:hypothetical protein
MYAAGLSLLALSWVKAGNEAAKDSSSCYPLPI